MLVYFSHDLNMWFLGLDVFANCRLWLAGHLLNVLLLSWLYAHHCYHHTSDPSTVSVCFHFRC